MPELVIALPKGRVLHELAALWQRAGFDAALLQQADRTLIRHDRLAGAKLLLLKPDDVPTYVEYGAADLGIVGRDVLWERAYDLYAPLDLGIGRCRLSVAGLPASAPAIDRRGGSIRVATKYPNLAARHFAASGHAIEMIFVQGSVELAPITGLADCIVDLVASGETLRQNGLVEQQTICEVTSVVVGNRVGFKLKQSAIRPLLSALAAVIQPDAGGI